MINEMVINSYFDQETISKINSMLTYTSYYDTFKFVSNDDNITHLYESYVAMK